MRKTGNGGAAALGVTVKSGWACAVVLGGSSDAPEVALSRRIELSDPDDPEARQPYHDGFGTARRRGPELTRLITAVKRFGARSVAELLHEAATQGEPLVGVGIVVGSLIDPQKIANDHIRIHAEEGRLFRGIVEEAAARKTLPHQVWRDRDLLDVAAGALDVPEDTIRRRLAALGKTKVVPGPWRAEQKSAALAAWLTLTGATAAMRPAPRR
jgi:hypothetical protein